MPHIRRAPERAHRGTSRSTRRLRSANREPERPKGASAGTIVFGVVVLLFGALTVTVGLLMNSSMFSFVEFNRITGYLFAGLGILLSLIAIVMGVSSHWRNKNRGA